MVILLQQAFQPETVSLVLRILAFAAGKIAAGEAEVIDSVEQVGFTGAIPAGDAYNPLVEVKGCLAVIFKLYE